MRQVYYVCIGGGCVLTKQKAWDQDSHLEVKMLFRWKFRDLWMDDLDTSGYCQDTVKQY